MVMPSTIHGTELSACEFQDSLQLRYARSPPNLPTTCDGCGGKFSVQHGLECHRGGLIIGRHNELRDELVDLGARALSQCNVHDEPLIFPQSVLNNNDIAQPDGEVINISGDNAERGDVLFRGFWARATDCILDVRITDTDSKSQQARDPKKVLASHEQQKKKKYLTACLDQRRHFSPFVVSVDGLFGKEAEKVLQRLAVKISERNGMPYSRVCSFVRTRMSIAVIRAAHVCLRGSRTPTNRMSNRPQWEGCSGLESFRS